MSWSIFVQELPSNARSLDDIAHEFVPKPLGLRRELIERMRGFEPTVDFTNPSWGHFNGPGFSVEFSLGERELVTSFALHARGSEQAASFISALVDHLGLTALDPASPSGIFEPGEAAQASFVRWRDYRDRVLGASEG